jgi:hypothetical protein
MPILKEGERNGPEPVKHKRCTGCIGGQSRARPPVGGRENGEPGVSKVMRRRECRYIDSLSFCNSKCIVP